MMKQTFYFMLCMAPLTVNAEIINLNPGNGISYQVNGLTATDNTYVFESGRGISVTDGGITIEKDFLVGTDFSGLDSTAGYVYVETTAGVQNTGNDYKSFNIQSNSDITVGGALNISNGFGVGIGIEDTATGNPINISFGSITANGSLRVEEADKFTVNGAIAAANNLSITANTMSSGDINITGGDTELDIAGAAQLGSLINTGGGDTSITAGTLAAGTIQNNADAASTGGDMTIVLGTGESTIENIYNNAANMTIGYPTADGDTGTITPSTSPDLVVSGVITNDSPNGILTLNLNSLTVKGGDESNPSVVLGGDFYATVTGDTYLEHGFDLSVMQENDSVFHLDTGTLAFGPDTDATTWANVFSNNLSDFFLAVRNSTIGTTGAPITIENGSGNKNANMELIAQNITAASIVNYADLTINADKKDGASIVVNNNLTGYTNSTTNITSGGTINVAGNVSNAGEMHLGAATVELGGITNTGEILTVRGQTSAAGSITVNGNIENNTTMAVPDTTAAKDTYNLVLDAKNITIDGSYTNTNGTANIRASDSDGGMLTITDSMDISAGTVNMNALAGGVNIGQTLFVTGGALNLDTATHNLVVGGDIQIGGDVTVGGTSEMGGSLNIAAYGPMSFKLQSTAGTLNIVGDIFATSTNNSDNAYGATFDASAITVGGAVTANNNNTIAFQGNTTSTATITSTVTANSGGTIKFASGKTTVGALSGAGKFVASGKSLAATTGAIDIENGIWFDDDATQTAGLIISNTDQFTLTTQTGAINIAGGIAIESGKDLTLESATSALISGTVRNTGTLAINTENATTFGNTATSANIINNGNMTVSANSIVATNTPITNSGADATLSMVATGGDVTVGEITNTGTSVKISGNNITTRAIATTAGTFDITGASVKMAYLTVGADGNTNAVMNINAPEILANNSVTVYGDMTQGTDANGALNLVSAGESLFTIDDALTVNGNFSATGNSVFYDITNTATFTGGLTVANAASVNMMAKNITIIGTTTNTGVTNAGKLTLDADAGITLAQIAQNSGELTLDSGTGIITVNKFEMAAGANTGTITLAGVGMETPGAFTADGTLYQNAGAISGGDINIASNKYEITTSNLQLAGINQTDGTLIINTSDIDIGGNIVATDLHFMANPGDNWMNVNVTGSVSGGVQFTGLEQMTIGKNYTFNNNSLINAAILPYATGVTANSTTRNYWSTVSLNDDNTLGTITNATDGQAMITVGGEFIFDVTGIDESDLNFFGEQELTQSKLQPGQIGLTLFDIVDQGTAIWLVHADKINEDENISESLFNKIRNLNVNFCNANGSICFNYLDSLDANNNTGTELPAYLSVRDTDGDGINDSIYVVFDPRFGGPVEVFKIQPIVGRVVPHTDGEYMSAGALDDLIAGQLQNTGFYNRTPIEAIPAAFNGTNMQTLATELYNRMEYYNTNRDGTALARFSRLVQPREVEQIAGSIALNEHTNFRSFEDRMFDEFIWNRNRNLNKAWVDAEFGMFVHDVSDGKRVDGNRFSVAGGFDWQHSERTIFGLTAHVSNMSGENSDSMELGYKPGESLLGAVNMDVENTNIGVGGYMMKILGDKTRVYGNAFLDLHLFDITRDQTFVDTIDGDGTAFSLISEWGLMHDWLNQYIVGNAYARVGYNFGFSVDETVGGQDYMEMESDGYFILTPGYSLTAQKRIYPTAWFQMRPYASIGVEYDVFGAPDNVKYKFAPAHKFTKYDIDIDPLWANIGGGIEFLSANGLQIGLDYRYQYNNAIQLHNIKLSGSYRF